MNPTSLEITGLDLSEGQELGALTSMAVPCVADVLATAHSEEALQGFLRRAHVERWRVHLLGGGSNTIFCGGRFEGVVLRLGREFAQVWVEGNEIVAGAAAPLSAVVRKAAEHDLQGLEFCMGIPGQVGGALAGNAGQRGESICPLVGEVRGVTREGDFVQLRQGEFAFSYRFSSLSQMILTQTRFVLKACESSDIRNKLQGFLSVRKEQPVGVRSSGCIFKNPEGDSAGRLIDAAGLKGFAIGGAEVSRIHANFIVNREGASSAEIQSLIDHIRATVKDRFGVELQLEVRLVH